MTRRGSDDKIAHRITTYLNDRKETGDLLFATHAGFLGTPHWNRADTWNCSLMRRWKSPITASSGLGNIAIC